MTGYIKLYRDIEQNDIWNNDEPFDYRSAWIDLLLLASHKDHFIIKNGRAIESKRGQVNRSIKQLADKWGWSRDKVKRFLEMLKTMKMASTDKSTLGHTITIENYSKWQDGASALESADKSTDKSTLGHPTSQHSSQHSGTYNNDKEGIEGERMIKNGEREASEEGPNSFALKDGTRCVSGIQQRTPEETKQLLDDAHADFIQAVKDGKLKAPRRAS